MKVENAELEAFVATAELLSFQRAAEKLHLTQPGLSRRIQKLEQTMGVELFHRTTRSVSLTGVGRHFLPMARQQIANLSEMLDSIKEVADKRFGKIRVASIPTVVHQLFPALLREYAASHPNIGVQIFDGNHDFVARQVQTGVAEFGIGMDPGADGELSFQPLVTDRYVLAVPAAHPLASRTEVGLEDLRSTRLIIGGRDSGNRLLLEVLLGSSAMSLRWFYEVEHVSCVMALVEAGLGCAIVPALSLVPREGASTRAVAIAGREITRTVGVMRHRSLTLSPLAGAFLDLLTAHFRGPPRPAP